MFYRRFGKRLCDVTLAVLALTVLSPLFALFALLIKLTSRGPVFYVQERIGKDGVPFRFIKFRTMVVGAETHGAGILCLKNDPRVTAVGRLLRRSSLDELPQLINVLRGEMSVVGPRPGLAYQVKEYTPEQRRRLTRAAGDHRLGAGQRTKRDQLGRTDQARYRVRRTFVATHGSSRSASHARGHRSQRYADRGERPFQGEGGEVRGEASKSRHHRRGRSRPRNARDSARGIEAWRWSRGRRFSG